MTTRQTVWLDDAVAVSLPPWRDGHTAPGNRPSAPRERNPMTTTDERAPAQPTHRAERLVHVSDDTLPLTDADQVADLLTNGLGWSHSGVRPATEAERMTVTASSRTENGSPAYWWMVRLPATIEQTISEFEANETHYYAAIWTQTWGTTVARVEVAMTW